MVTLGIVQPSKGLGRTVVAGYQATRRDYE